MKYKTYFRTSILCALFVVGLTLPLVVEAATLFLNPEIGEHSLGDTFTAEVRIDTQGEVINTIQADLVFPSDLIEVVSLGKENSILSLWISDPVYLNQQGLISFVGGLPAPGYQGKDGLIGRITFKAKSGGKAEVSFQENSSRVLLNDGFGTEALLKTKGALYNLSSIKKKLFSGFLALLVIIFLILIVWRNKKTKSVLTASLLAASILGGGLFGSSVLAAGATLSLTPASGEFSVGQTIQSAIRFHSGGNLVNAAEATLNFSPDSLRVVSLSKANSIFSFWPVEPTSNNATGVISFGGGTPTPFSGPGGTLLNITFFVKKAGETSLSFSSGRVLVADGSGTDVFSGSSGANWKLAATRLVSGVPKAPTLSSPTHPDPAKWYSVNDAKFSWLLTQDNTGASLLVGRIPEVVPTVTYIPPISSREVADLEDGVWYFHVRLQNAAGWGDTAHFRFQIDTTKPNRFEISEIERANLIDPKVKFVFDASDQTSGVDLYEITIDGKQLGNWRDDGTHIYAPEPLGPGKHILVAKAVDKAGNFLANSAEFEIVSLGPSVITEHAQKLESGKTLIISLVAPLLLLLLLIWYWLHRFLTWRRKIKKEVGEAEEVLHKAFDSLKEDGRGKTIKQVKKDLDDAEKSVRKEIEDIEKEVR